ncbi:glycoside hydrolase family 19 protein [Renibacterium salmoninarum]|uniref:glycoside hydrolase family 19 protein n=1 Tax=Renibacterium salmoninarum TaxID=1646 RepID=UPI000301BE6E|nr:glycoside hydrolase family 19 protein [Renibacterium salmoninarum]
MKKLLALLTASAAAALLLVAAPGAAQAATTGTITGIGGKCIDAAAGKSDNGTAVQIYDCNGTNAQQITIGDDQSIRMLGKCLDIVDRSTSNGGKVQLWDCANSANQKWAFSNASEIVNPAANRCLDAEGQKSDNGTRLMIWDCTGNPNQKWTVHPSGNPPSNSEFPISEAQFNQLFPNRNSTYSYQGLVSGAKKYPAFATTGDDATKKREVAAFLANVQHETGSLQYLRELNTANYPHYCDRSQPYGCPAGGDQYYGRGSLQLSWNYNYKAAGDSLGFDLLNNPDQVATNPTLAWGTGLWYWNTQSGGASTSSHDSIVQNRGFGETIRSINGGLECNGNGADSRNARINYYKNIAGVLGVDPGGNLSC